MRCIKSKNQPCAEVHYEDYSGRWVKIRNLYDYSYYKVNFHIRNGKEYKFFYTDYLQIFTHSKGGQWYHTRVKRSDLHSTCVSASRGEVSGPYYRTGERRIGIAP